jgi:hypothetical protein
MRTRNLLFVFALLIAGIGLSTAPVTAQIPGNCFWECNCSVSCSTSCFYNDDVDSRVNTTCGQGEFLCSSSPEC